MVIKKGNGKNVKVVLFHLFFDYSYIILCTYCLLDIAFIFMFISWPFFQYLWIILRSKVKCLLAFFLYFNRNRDRSDFMHLLTKSGNLLLLLFLHFPKIKYKKGISFFKCFQTVKYCLVNLFICAYFSILDVNLRRALKDNKSTPSSINSVFI